MCKFNTIKQTLKDYIMTKKNRIPIIFLSLLMLAGCGKEAERKIAKLEEQIKADKKEINYLKQTVAASQGMEKALAAANDELKKAEEAMALLKKREQMAKERLSTAKDILKKLKLVIESGDLKVRVKKGKMVLEMPSAVLFGSGKAELSKKGKKTLDTVASVLKDIKNREFQVAGHTDNVKVSENNPYGDNWRLSAARSIAVVHYLIDQNISPENLSAAGYAQYQPTASNKTRKGKARNRRIEITLMPNLKELPDLSELEKELDLKDKPTSKTHRRRR
jgi:chemotaxis protein MotB